MIHWTLDPSILLGLAALALLRFAPWPPLLPETSLTPVPSPALLARGTNATRRSPRQRCWRGDRGEATWLLGLIVLAIALISPLDYLADHVLFLAHMLQHLLLLLVVPPLLLLGLPAEGFAWIRRALDRLGPAACWLVQPFPAFLLSTLVVWAWHVPTFYEAALASEPLHAAEHLAFLGTALLYWWPVVRPEEHPAPMLDLFQLPYLLGAIVASSLLAALLTFAPDVLYPTYTAAAFAPARAAIGLTPLLDQQLGGLLMWVGGGLWYLLAAGGVMVRWFARDARETRLSLPQARR